MQARTVKKVAICAAIAVASAVTAASLSRIRFFQLLDLKAQDTHFVIRGQEPTKDIVLITIDNKTLNKYHELEVFWHRYFADAMRAVADNGAKVLVLDKFFAIPVSTWEPDHDSYVAQSFNDSIQKMPVICAFVPEAVGDQDASSAVPLNMMAMTFGLSAFANLTADSDDFIRRQELIEAPKEGVPPEGLARSMALRAAEKIVGKDAEFHDGKLYLAGREVPLDENRALTINFAGPPSTFPAVSLYDFLNAVHAKDTAKLESWVKGKIVLLGPDNSNDRYSTPFFTFFGGGKWNTAGVEIHANTLRTILDGNFLRPVPQWIRMSGLLVTAAVGIGIAVPLGVGQTVAWSFVALGLFLTATHLFFLSGWVFSSSEVFIAYLLSLVGGVVYRFATAERKSSFFKGAMALFVGKQVAQSLEQTEQIGLTGKRRHVTILFTDIRGFTAFCESKDPAEIVALLNDYMQHMVSIIVRYEGHVNKFIGDGILAVFSDDDDHAKPGDHGWRAVACATEMVKEPFRDTFKSGAGLHSGEVIIGNVGSSDKMEFTVLGDTVNLASRLESLNKEQKTKLLMSHETYEMLGGKIDTVFKAVVPVRGKTEPMKLYTVAELVEHVEEVKLDAKVEVVK